MYHRDVIAAVARRLPHRTRRDVAEIIDILTEVWSEELINGREIILPDIGRASIEIQHMTAGGTLSEYGQFCRIYGRFRPTPKLKNQVRETELEQTQGS